MDFLGGSVTEIPGILVGHAQDFEAITGCTVVLCPEGTIGGVDVRGGAATTKATESLHPGQLVDRIDAVVLTGGSAFGLDCVGGVMQFLEERQIGFEAGVTKVPIVAGAVLFDLAIGDSARRPDREMGYQACCKANSNPPKQGSVGGGTGATVGKLWGMKCATKSGVGTACLSAHGGLKVGALFAVNAFGDILDFRNGELVAGLRDPTTGKLTSTLEAISVGATPQGGPQFNTVIGAVVTNAKLSKAEVERVAMVAQDGIALSISPAHTMVDGDVIFSLATGQVDTSVDLVASLATRAVAVAILSAALEAEGLGGVPTCKEL